MAVILAIDEDVVLTMSLDLQLGHVGHTVRRANTITAALSHYSDLTPNVVVIDPGLEQQNGWQLVTQWASTVPVVVISHDPTDSTKTRAESLGCVAVLSKPFLMRDLVNALTPYLDAQPTKKSASRKRGTASQPVVNSQQETPPPTKKRNQRTAPQPTVPNPPQREDTLGIGISDADEELLSGLPTTMPEENRPEPRQETLGMRMRQERLKLNIPLSQIDLLIGVHMAHVQAMEEDRFSYLPRGKIAEDIITKYVRFLGMDVNEVLQMYRSFKYSEHVEPLTSYGADKLTNMSSYAWILQVFIALAILAGIGWGIYIIDRPRVMQYAGVVVDLIYPTLTASLTPTITLTPSATATVTASRTATITLTASNTATTSPSATPTATTSNTATITPSQTASITASSTITTTPSRTSTATKSSTITITPSVTASQTASSTVTLTASNTATATTSRTASVTRSRTPSKTDTATRTLRPSRTATATRTSKPSATTTPSNTAAATASKTASATRTPLGARTSPTVRPSASATKKP